MKWLKRFAMTQIILLPLAVYMVCNNQDHPEKWDVWYCNPTISAFYALAIEGMVAGACVYLWQWERRREKGLRMLKKAIRLQEMGNHDAAEVAYQDGRRLSGIKQSRRR